MVIDDQFEDMLLVLIGIFFVGSSLIGTLGDLDLLDRFLRIIHSLVLLMKVRSRMFVVLFVIIHRLVLSNLCRVYLAVVVGKILRLVVNLDKAYSSRSRSLTLSIRRLLRNHVSTPTVLGLSPRNFFNEIALHDKIVCKSGFSSLSPRFRPGT